MVTRWLHGQLRIAGTHLHREPIWSQTDPRITPLVSFAERRDHVQDLRDRLR